MKSNKLLRTPLPKPDEDYMGYWIRVSETNGYENIRHLLGSTLTCLTSIKTDSKNLFDLTGYEANNLLGASNDIKVNWLGHEIFSRYFSKSDPKVCPDCIAEKGYQQGKHGLTLNLVCLEHARLLIKACTKCSLYLNDSRQGLNLCQKGHSLKGEPKQPIPPCIMDLQIVIDAVINRGFAEKGFLQNSKLPISKLMNLDLNVLLALIESFGIGAIYCGFYKPSKLNESREISILAGANQVFNEWPHNFTKFLNKYHQSHFEKSFHKDNDWAHAFEHLIKEGLPNDQIDFIREVYITYVNQALISDDDVFLQNSKYRTKKVRAAINLYALVSGLTPKTIMLKTPSLHEDIKYKTISMFDQDELEVVKSNHTMRILDKEMQKKFQIFPDRLKH